MLPAEVLMASALRRTLELLYKNQQYIISNNALLVNKLL